MAAMDPFEAARRVAAQLEAIFAIHRENLGAMSNAAHTIRDEVLLMRAARATHQTHGSAR